MNFPKCMCDLGAAISVMPTSIAAKLGLTNFKPGKVKLQMADQSSTECLGVLPDIPVVVNNTIVPTDFAVVYMPDEPTPSLLLGRPFLASTNALIDCTSGNIQLRIGKFRMPIFTREGEILDGTPKWDESDESLSGDSDTYALEPLPPDEWNENNSPRAEEEMNDFLDSEPEVMMLGAHNQEESIEKKAPRLQTLLSSLDPDPTELMGPQKARRVEVLKRLKDPGPLTLPCSIAKLSFPKCLIDTGAAISIMPLSIAEEIGFKDFPYGEVTLRMADLSVVENYGVIKYMPVRINGVEIPTDFVIMKMDKEPEYGLILGRPFLNTTDAIMDMVDGFVSLNLGGPNRVTFPRYETIPYEDSLLGYSTSSSEEEEEQDSDPEEERNPPRSPPQT